MASRSYRQLCSVARALDLVGERWTLLIVRDLLPGPLGYKALLDGLPGLTTNLLAKRLRELRDRGLLEKLKASDGESPKGAYRLTAAGRALAPVLSALSTWGLQYGAAACPEASLNFRWIRLLLARRYRQTGGRWIVQLNCKDQHLQLRLGGAEFDVTEGNPLRPDLILEADGQTWFAFLAGERDLPDLLEQKLLRVAPGVSGEDQAEIWRDFLSSFSLEASAAVDS
ncbi:MAG: transcriptional regulator [Planctomycetota bacterium]|nr:MAG: transcriptional regulator [Planctomycetota bacterium]